MATAHFTTVSFSFCRTLLVFGLCAAAVLLPIFSLSVAAEEEKRGAFQLFTGKKEAAAPERITVDVKGVEEPLLGNVYNHLAIYRLRSHARLQQVSVHQLFRQAEEDIKKALAPFGYYTPKITSALNARPVEAGEPPRWEAFFTIEKGPPVLVDAVALQLFGEGRENRALNKQVKSFALKKGAVLDQKVYEQEKKKLIHTARSEGYLNVGFTRSEVRIDPAENRGSIWLYLDSGDRFSFGETTIVTTPPDAFKNSLLQGYLPWKTGDAYNFGKLFELQSILYSSEYFTTVDVRGKVDEAVDGLIPVEAVVTIPEKDNKYIVGLGYATDSGARAKLNWKNRMLNSNGDKIGAALEIAQLEKNIYLTYERPRKKNPRYDRYVATSSYQDKTWDDTDTRLLTLALGRDYSVPTFNFGGGLEFRDEVYEIGDTSGSSTLLVPSANAGFVLADDLVHTQHGLRVSAKARGAVEGVVSDANFFQWTLSGKALLTPFKNWRILGRVALGMTVVDSIDSLPPSLRFYAGGDTSIRGYSYKSIGPKDKSRTVVGGRYLSVQSVEIERLFGQYFGLAAFWDVGTATNDLSLDYQQGAGLGIRVHMPFGEIKLDLASAISEPDYPFQVHFSVGGSL